MGKAGSQGLDPPPLESHGHIPVIATLFYLYDRPLTAAIAERIDSWSRLQRISHARPNRIDACKDCTAYTKCGAGCMGRAYSVYGDFFAVEDRCLLRKAVCRKAVPFS